MPDAVVLGAGFAGLAAARRLVAAGLSVVVLEATDRVGGRAFTVRLGEHDVELGAEWVDSTHRRLRALLDAVGMRLKDPPTTFDFVWKGPGPSPLPALERYQNALGALLPSPGLDARSLASLISETDPVLRRAVERRVAAEYADLPAAVSLLFAAEQEALPHASWSRRVDGGLGQLAARLAEPLDVRLSSPVASVSARGGVVVDGIAARACVVALPLPALARIAWDPPLPPLVARAAAEVRYGPITKVALRYRGRWGATTFTDSVVPRLYESSVVGDECVVTAYVAGPDSASATVDLVAAQVAPQRPDLGEPLGAASRAWAQAPSGGAYAVYGPGQVTTFLAALREQRPPIFFAGEHLAVATGYVEGAVESGETAADAVAAFSAVSP